MGGSSLAGSSRRIFLFEGTLGHAWEIAAFNPNVFYDAALDSYVMVYRGTTNDGSDFKPGEYMSSIGFATSRDGLRFERKADPIIGPTEPYEDAMGCEDPVLQKVDGEYLITYDAVGGHGPGVRMAIATSSDLTAWKKRGVIGPNRTAKSLVMFPEPIDGDLVALYSLAADSAASSI